MSINLRKIYFINLFGIKKIILYLLTAKIFEKLGGNKKNSPLGELSDENTAELMKFFYMTYQRITEGKNVLNLKPEKIYGVQQELIDKKGIGMLHRALFTTEREKKEKKEGKEKGKHETKK
jgi:hypothetical protein